jgi:hypothetical protein
MNYYIIPDEDALGTCALCNGRIYEDEEVFAIGTKFQSGVDLTEYAGHCIEISLNSEEKTMNMMVTAEGSEAKLQNKDGMFLVCSEGCGTKLKDVLKKEVSSGDMFDTVID